MDYPKFSVSIQKEESICIQRFKTQSQSLSIIIKQKERHEKSVLTQRKSQHVIRKPLKITSEYTCLHVQTRRELAINHSYVYIENTDHICVSSQLLCRFRSMVDTMGFMTPSASPSAGRHTFGFRSIFFKGCINFVQS